MSPLEPGSRLGRFEVSSVLGRGAMGTVYLGHDPEIDRPVAIKTLRASGEDGELAREVEARFLKEARLAGRLQHENVVTIYEAGRDQGVSYIAMEYVDGEPLDEYLAKRRSLPLPERLDLMRQAALALEHAHARGVLHRDVKPGNILVTREGKVKVADFGIGKLLSDGAELTRTGQMVGSPAYMSPEQIRGDKLDGSSDFFSLGVVLFEVLTGSRPFPGDSITTLVYQILHTEPRDPLKVKSDLPPSVRPVFARLLAKSRADRPKNAAEFVRELDRLEERLSEKTLALPRSPLVPGGPSPSAQPQKTSPPASPPRVTAPAPPSFPQAPVPTKTAGSTAAAARRPPWILLAAAVAAALALFLVLRRPHRAPAVRAGALSGGGGALSTPAAEPAAAASSTTAAEPHVAPSSRRPSARTAERGEDSASRRVAPDLSPPASGFDRVYRTRHFVKFGVSPDQARVYLDGRYVGIADDWDDRGGGKTLELPRRGVHQIRVALPGYRTLNFEVVRSTGARDETVEINDSLPRVSNAYYPKFEKVDDRTVGPVEFRVEPSNATVREGKRTFGLASAFGPGSPLRLSGPRVHDLVISAPGHRPKTVRILVASNADSDRASVKVELKRN